MIVALDVGGTSVKSGVVVGGQVVIGVRRRPLDEGAPSGDLVGVLAGVIRDHIDGVGEVSAIAIAFPAPFDYAAGIPMLRHKFARLYGLHLGAELAARLDATVPLIGFVNDAEASVVGEAVYGAGQGTARVLGLTLGTGLGAALVVDGVPVLEMGGLVVGDVYRIDVDGQPADDRFSARGLAEQLELDPATGLEPVADAARAGEHAERAAFERFGSALGAFVAVLVDRVDPDVVIIGGGLAAAFDLFGGSLQAAVAVPVASGALGPTAALVGAAHLVSNGRRDVRTMRR